MRRLLLFACAAILLAGCAPEDLQSLLPTIQSGAIGKDVFLFEDNVVVTDVVEGDLFAWGDSVQIDGKVEGSVFAYGTQVQINGTVDGSITVVGREVVLGPSGHVGQGVLFAGVLLQMQEGAIVDGGVTAVGYQVLLDGSIGEYVRGAMLRLRLDGTVGANPSGALLLFGGLARHAHAAWLAAPAIGADAMSVTGLGSGAAAAAPTFKGGDPWRELALDLARELATLLVFGLLVVAFRPTLLYVVADRVRAEPLASAGYGIFVLIVGYIGGALLAVVLGFLGFWLFNFSLDVLAVALLAGGGAALGLGLVMLTLFAAYGTKLVLGAWAGRLILGRLAPRAADHRYWPLLLGTLLYLIVAAIPYLGQVVSLATSLLGLGAAWLVMRELRSAR
jgi:cytoskeletal protein CcmA (bactofilin family)